MKQSTFINTTTLMASASARPQVNNSVLIIPGKEQEEEPKRKITSWNWEPFNETYSIPVNYQGAA